MIIYHGSEKIIEKPVFGKGNLRNDYGKGFYCTESEELANAVAEEIEKQLKLLPTATTLIFH